MGVEPMSATKDALSAPCSSLDYTPTQPQELEKVRVGFVYNLDT